MTATPRRGCAFSRRIHREFIALRFNEARAMKPEEEKEAKAVSPNEVLRSNAAL